MTDKKIQTCIYLTKELKDKFNQLCKEKHIVGSRLIEEFIQKWIKEQAGMKAKQLLEVIKKNDWHELQHYQDRSSYERPYTIFDLGSKGKWFTKYFDDMQELIAYAKWQELIPEDAENIDYDDSRIWWGEFDDNGTYADQDMDDNVLSYELVPELDEEN